MKFNTHCKGNQITRYAYVTAHKQPTQAQVADEERNTNQTQTHCRGSRIARCAYLTPHKQPAQAQAADEERDQKSNPLAL